MKSHSLAASPKAPSALATTKFEVEVKKEEFVKGSVANGSKGFKGLMTYKDSENPENQITYDKKFVPVDSSKMIERNQKDIEVVQSKIQELQISIDSKKKAEPLRKTPAASWREEEKKEAAKLAYGHDGSKPTMEELARKTGGGDFNLNNNKAVVDYQKKLNTSSNPPWATYNYETAGKTSSSAYGGHYRFQK